MVVVAKLLMTTDVVVIDGVVEEGGGVGMDDYIVVINFSKQVRVSTSI